MNVDVVKCHYSLAKQHIKLTQINCFLLLTTKSPPVCNGVFASVTLAEKRTKGDPWTRGENKNNIGGRVNYSYSIKMIKE